MRRRPPASPSPLSSSSACSWPWIGGTGELELRIEQSDNDGHLVVWNDSGETVVVQLLGAAKVIREVPLESDESWHFHPE